MPSGSIIIGGRHPAVWLAMGVLALGCVFARGLAAELLVRSVAEFQSALAVSQPGDAIVLADGVWTNADLLFKRNGTAAQPITLRAQTPGQVILSGQSRLRIAGSWLVVDGLRFENGSYTNDGFMVVSFRENSSVLATNCTLINCVIRNFNPPSAAVEGKWVSIYGLSNRVENCYFEGKTNLGATLVVWLPASPTNLPNHHVIRRNHFGPCPPLGQNGAETIRVGDSATSMNLSRTLVEENLFRACNGEIETISNKSCENVYRYNTFEACEGTLTLRHGNACAVYGNWFFGRGRPQTGGVRIIGEDHLVYNNYFEGLTGTGLRSAICYVNGVPDSALDEYFQVRRARVLFNTIVHCARAITIGQPVTGGTLPPADCTAANNLVYGTNAPLVSVVTAPTNFLWAGNVFFGAAVGVSDPGIVVTNPLLSLALDGLWRPASNSPALGAAVGDYPWVVDEIDGQPRAGNKDVGCDQVSGTPAMRRPLGVADVGPAWMRSVGPIRVGATGAAVTLRWPVLPGFRYRVFYTTNLSHWTTGPMIVPTESEAVWVDDGMATGGSPLLRSGRFYRVGLEL